MFGRSFVKQPATMAEKNAWNNRQKTGKWKVRIVE